MIDLRLLGTLDLRDADGRDLHGALAQPKRFALLAYLAAATPAGFHRRDRLVALLWPELDQEHARTALRKGVHALRSVLGETAVVGRGTEELGLAAGLIRCDSVEFERALDEQRPEDALERYRGDLLDGFFISGAPEFERWLERERTRLRARAAAAAWTLAQQRETQGDSLAALRLARRAVSLSPDDETAVRRLIALLDRLGDRAGALHAYQSFARQLQEDFAAEPSAETRALIDAVRQRVVAAARRGSDPPPLPAVRAPDPPPPPPAPALPAARRWGVRAAAVAVVVLGAGAWSARYWWPGYGRPVTTASAAAYQRYQEGTAAYARGDFAAAQRAFEVALGDDSAFAMAAFYAGLSASVRNDNDAYTRYLTTALRLAPHVRERERLLIRATWSDRQGNPDALALAESLTARFPDEAAGQGLLGSALIAVGDFLGAIPHLRIAAAADSASLRPGAPGPCPACQALQATWYAYFMADSLPAAERLARDWVRRQPGSAEAWQHLAMAFELENRLDQALTAIQTAATLRSGDLADAMQPITIAIRGARFAEADRRLRVLAADSSRAVRQEAAWNQAISLRYQGRLREALAAGLRFRRGGGPDAPVSAGLVEAQVLYEMGRGREAAALFDSIAAVAPLPYSRARAARNRAWYLTHAATARAAGTDTVGLDALADTIEAVGEQSNYGRDHLLHHHARGLSLLAQRRLAEAAEEFQRAEFSATGGFSRNNLELARVLLRLGRPAAAVPPLQAALRGPEEASGLYCTFTELHEALGQAFAAAGLRDSAAAHYRWVLAAWAHADPAFAARRAAVAARLAALARRPISDSPPRDATR
jgi:DNA-binding SARP family transcriptional activator